MPTVGQLERKTQQRVVKLFRERLGYDYLGDWTDREGNANIEPALVRGWLARQGVEDALISRALHALERAAGDTGKSLYDRNRAVYELLRYGVKLRPDVGENTATVWLIDWKESGKNDFAIAEEVTVAGADAKAHDKRPDVVLYVNGIALGVLELKRSTVSVAEGIRQNLDNQKKIFIEHFFSTMQWVMAGNDTEGLRYQKMLADWFQEPPEKAVKRVEEFEKAVKKKFINDPGQMKLLFVVNKLLTGFDAPPATFLYIDQQMHDHGLFQAICRVNRLDGDDKPYGYVIDYKDLFKSLEGAMHDYTSGALDGYDREDVAGLLEDRLAKARERLEEALETVRALCEPVEPPRDQQAYFRYFSSKDHGDAEQLRANEPQRLSLYRLVAALVRAYADIASEMPEAGYEPAEGEGEGGGDQAAPVSGREIHHHLGQDISELPGC